MVEAGPLNIRFLEKAKQTLQILDIFLGQSQSKADPYSGILAVLYAPHGPVKRAVNTPELVVYLAYAVKTDTDVRNSMLFYFLGRI
jgi:hypothetical protein